MIRLLGAVILMVIALFMTSGYLQSDRDWREPATFVALLLVVGLPLLGAALLVRSHSAAGRARSDSTTRLRHQTIESEVLKLAAERGGRLTAVELAMHLAIAPEAATEALDRLALRGQAEYAVSDAGVIVYTFHDIIHLDGKDSARNVLDA
jgi:hypothetical protein